MRYSKWAHRAAMILGKNTAENSEIIQKAIEYEEADLVEAASNMLLESHGKMPWGPTLLAVKSALDRRREDKMGDAKEIRNIRQAMRRFDAKHGTKHTFREKHHALAVSAVQRKEKRNEQTK